jgi:hypothetical protein
VKFTLGNAAFYPFRQLHVNIIKPFHSRSPPYLFI